MAVTLGPSGVTFSNNGRTLYNLPGGMGGATWHDVLASRPKNIIHYNTTGKQLWVSIYAATSANYTITVEGYPIFYTNSSGYTQSYLFCVNKGSQYAWASPSGTMLGWKELYI